MASPKKYGLFALAVVLLLLGAAALYVGSHNFTIRSFGLAALLVSVYLVRESRVYARSASEASDERADFTASNGPGRLAWVFGIALLPLTGISYLLMYIDALHGGSAAWPAYVFAGFAFACAGAWGYIASKLA